MTIAVNIRRLLSILLGIVAIGVSARSAQAIFLCCEPAAPGLVVITPCGTSLPCEGTCKTDVGLLPGGCHMTWWFGNCNDVTIADTHTISIYTCQDSMLGCPCPPPGAVPDSYSSYNINVNSCAGDRC